MILEYKHVIDPNSAYANNPVFIVWLTLQQAIPSLETSRSLREGNASSNVYRTHNYHGPVINHTGG